MKIYSMKKYNTKIWYKKFDTKIWHDNFTQWPRNPNSWIIIVCAVIAPVVGAFADLSFNSF